MLVSCLRELYLRGIVYESPPGVIEVVNELFLVSFVFIQFELFLFDMIREIFVDCCKWVAGLVYGVYSEFVIVLEKKRASLFCNCSEHN